MDTIDDRNNSFCSLVKTYLIKLLEYKNAPLILRTPDFLQSMRVVFDLELTLLVIFLDVANVEPFEPNFAQFMVDMAWWRHENENIFLVNPEHYFFRTYPPFFTFVMRMEGCVRLFKFVEQNCFGKFSDDLTKD